MHAAHARGIDGHRLLAEDVLAGVDGGLQVQRAEVGRRAEQHDFRVAVHHPLVAVEAGERGVVGDAELLVELRLQPLAALGQAGRGTGRT